MSASLENYGGNCKDFHRDHMGEKPLNCCSSCHEDEAEGYPSFEETEIMPNGKWYRVCCGVWLTFEQDAP